MIRLNETSQFPLFDNPIQWAQTCWQRLLLPTDLAIDATCGNGHDTLRLAELLPEGTLIALDRQEKAILATKERIRRSLPETYWPNVHFYMQCHSSFPPAIQPGTVKLVVYNLGYLPGGEKQNTTVAETTLASLEAAIRLLVEGGIISITCYPGHPEGAIEEKAIIQFASHLDPKHWSCSHQLWVNRNKGPSLLLIQKAFCC